MADRSVIRTISALVLWPVCVLLCASLYLASFGPVVWLVHNEVISFEAGCFLGDTVYLPFDWVDRNTSVFEDTNPIGRLYSDYLDLFER